MEVLVKADMTPALEVMIALSQQLDRLEAMMPTLKALIERLPIPEASMP